MKTMREKFEELPEIKDILHTVIFNDQFNNYHDAMINSSPSVYFIRGAWYAFQEQQKIINMQECGVKEIKLILESINPYDMDIDTIGKVGKLKDLLK